MTLYIQSGGGYTNLHTIKSHEAKHACAREHIHIMHCTPGKGESRNKLWGVWQSHFPALTVYVVMRDVTSWGEAGRRVQGPPYLFLFFPTFRDYKYFKIKSIFLKSWEICLKVSPIHRNAEKTKSFWRIERDESSVKSS